jgi:hypothetical protein
LERKFLKVGGMAMKINNNSGNMDGVFFGLA